MSAPAPGLPRWARYLLAFLLGGAALLALFELFGTPPPPAQSGGGVDRTRWIWIALGVLGAAFVLLQLRRAYRRGRTLSQQHAQAVALLNEGRAEEALAAFEQVARSAEATDAFRALATYNVGHTQLRLGRPGDAVATLKAALELPGAKTDVLLRAAMASELALAQALLGELPAANSSLQSVPAKNVPEPPVGWVFAWTVIALREGRLAEAAAYLERSWPVLERRMSAGDLRLLQGMAASAIERSGGDPQRVQALRERAGSFGDQERWLTAHLPDWSAH